MPKSVKANRVHEYAGPEVLQFDEVQIGAPGPGEGLIRHNAIGGNFADLHTRNGRYPLPHLPHCIGAEASGVIEAKGEGVEHLSIGDRVAYSSGGHALPRGAYCEARVMAAHRLFLLPDELDDETAAAMTTKGLTAHYLIHDVYPVGKGDTIAVHAAAGGVGQILCQWANHLGARVIGIVGTPEKEETAASFGCRHTLGRGRDDVVGQVRSLSDGEGVAVVYDSVGADTYEESLRCLRPRGLLASFGTASGPIPPVDLFQLNQLGSLYVTSAAFLWHLRNREEMLKRATDLIAMVVQNKIQISIGLKYPLSRASDAHRDMEARKTKGMSVLIP